MPAIHAMYFFLLQKILDMAEAAQPHEFIYIKAGFNLSKIRRRGCNIIGQRAIVHVPGQRGEASQCVLP